VTLSENAETESRASFGIKCYVKLNEYARETYEKLRWAYGELTVSRWNETFSLAVKLWKTNLVLKEIALQK
jgi:hypothetical protein